MEDISKEKKPFRTLIGGSVAESIVSIAAIAVVIIGLAGIFPNILLSISTIAIGAALLFHSGAIATHFSELIREFGKNRGEATGLGMGVSIETIGGLVGVALGILALLGILPMILLPVAAIVFGGSLLLGSGVDGRLNAIIIAKSGEEEVIKEMKREAVTATSDIQLLIGLAALTLGILALVGIRPLVLSLIAMLSIGVSDFLTGTSLTSRMFNLLR